MAAEPALRATEELPPFYIPADAAHATYRERVLKFGDAFAVLDHFGDAQATGPAAEGLFFEDTRYLSRLTLAINGQAPLLLKSNFISGVHRHIPLDHDGEAKGLAHDLERVPQAATDAGVRQDRGPVTAVGPREVALDREPERLRDDHCKDLVHSAATIAR